MTIKDMKTIHHSFILFLMLFLLPGRAFAQDIVYRGDGTVMSIDIVSIDGGTIIYKLPGDDSGKLHYLGISIVDSLK